MKAKHYHSRIPVSQGLFSVYLLWLNVSRSTIKYKMCRLTSNPIKT